MGAMPVPQPDLVGDTQPRGTLSAPDLRGMAAHDARRIGRMSELYVLVTDRPTEEALWGRVVAQDPAPGVALRPGDPMTITVGARPAVEVPDVRGGEEAEMLAVLRDAGLRPERRVARRSHSVPEGHIVRTRPRAGATVPRGTKVTYVVATPRPVHGGRARRHEKRARRLPDGTFLSLPSVE
jgi:serine/threonine-protein kinase